MEFVLNMQCCVDAVKMNWDKMVSLSTAIHDQTIDVEMRESVESTRSSGSFRRNDLQRNILVNTCGTENLAKNMCSCRYVTNSHLPHQLSSALIKTQQARRFSTFASPFSLYNEQEIICYICLHSNGVDKVATLSPVGLAVPECTDWTPTARKRRRMYTNSLYHFSPAWCKPSHWRA